MRSADATVEGGQSSDAPSASSTITPIQTKAAEQTDEMPTWATDLPKYADMGFEFGNCATPAGLKNIGNTCYLNSVLQYFFTIKEVRDQVMEAAKVIQRTPELRLGGELRVGGRVVSPAEIERSRKFVVHLSNLFDNMITSPAAAVEPERELAYLALVSSRTEEAVLNTQNDSSAPQPAAVNTHAQPPTASDAMQTDHGAEQAAPASNAEGKAAESFNTGIQDADATLRPQEPAPRTELTAAALELNAAAHANATAPQAIAPQAQESLMQLGAQQDVGECLDNVVFQIEVGLRSAGAEPEPLPQSQEQVKPTSADAAASLNSAIERLFVGVSSQRVAPIVPAPDAKPSEPKQEIFTLIPIDITHEGCDVYDGLDNFFDDEEIEGSNVRRTVTLQQPPAILQIQAQRVLYDRAQGKAFKALTHLEVGDFISLDRYLELPSDHPKKAAHAQRRKATVESRTRQAEAIRRKTAMFNGKISIGDTLRSLSNTLGAYAARPGESGMDQGDLTALQQVLDQQAGEAQSDIETLDKEIASLKSAREQIWATESETLYELAAVFMHRGEATHGHYFLNQRQFPDPAPGHVRWLKYNDEQVSEATVQEVMKDSTGATPYLLIYVRRRPEPTATIETIQRLIIGVNVALPEDPLSGSQPHPSPEPANAAPPAAASGAESQGAEDVVMEEHVSETKGTPVSSAEIASATPVQETPTSTPMQTE